jgi:carboxylesterase
MSKTSKFVRWFSIGAILTSISGCGQPKLLPLQAGSEAQCLAQMQEKLEQNARIENTRAQALDPVGGAVRPGNEMRFLKGDPDRVVFLLHGFIGSPYEVIPLGEALHQKGYTVVMPLIAGFGRSTRVAQQTTRDEWLDQAREDLLAARTCSKPVHVIGFSLGAALLTHLILEHPELRDQAASIDLISPALVLQKESMLNLSATVLKLINPTPSVQWMQSLAQKIGVQDLRIPLEHPEFYNSEIPLASVRELHQLLKSIDWKRFAELGPRPVQLIYSENDRTIDGDTAFEAISRANPAATRYVIPRSMQVPHQVLVSGVPGVLESVAARVSH